MSMRPRNVIFLTLLLSTTASAAQETAENVRGITVTSPKPNENVNRRISIVGEVEFAQKPADAWAAFVVISAQDNVYYFSTWDGEINYEILRVRDVAGKPVARWKINSIFLGEAGAVDVGKSFDLFIVTLKESAIQGVVERVCPELAKTDRCIGSRTAYRDLSRGTLAPSASVSDPITVKRK